jgi:hypothetical protein
MPMTHALKWNCILSVYNNILTAHLRGPLFHVAIIDNMTSDTLERAVGKCVAWSP